MITVYKYWTVNKLKDVTTKRRVTTERHQVLWLHIYDCSTRKIGLLKFFQESLNEDLLFDSINIQSCEACERIRLYCIHCIKDQKMVKLKKKRNISLICYHSFHQFTTTFFSIWRIPVWQAKHTLSAKSLRKMKKLKLISVYNIMLLMTDLFVFNIFLCIFCNISDHFCELKCNII